MYLEFRPIEPHFLLKDYIEKMWVFRSGGKMAVEDMKLVVPNGNIKLTISYQNGIVADVDGKRFYSKEHDITLTGLINVPVILDVDKDVPTETIGIEFNPKGAYRFFNFCLNELQNKIYSITDVLGKTGMQLVEEINNATSLAQKTDVVQRFLFRRLNLVAQDPIFEYCIEKIVASNGTITIAELEKKTGYSSRWLNMKFGEKLGTSPKNISSVIRFKHYYEAFMSGDQASFFRNDFYQLYYDQSHFIKDFKRYTGLPPAKFEKQINDFGKKYYL